MKQKSEKKIPRNGSARAAMARRAGPMKDKRVKKAAALQKQELEEALDENSSLPCPECGCEILTDNICPSCKEE